MNSFEQEMTKQGQAATVALSTATPIHIYRIPSPGKSVPKLCGQSQNDNESRLTTTLEYAKRKR